MTFADPRVEKLYAETDFRVADTDADGSLTFEEYEGSGNALELQEIAKDSGADPNLHRAFADMDTNNDKKVSHQEYIAVQGVEMFGKRDKNKDGFISQKEYVDFEPTKEASELESIFEELDMDKDKQLTRVEARGLHHDVDFDKNNSDEKAAEFSAIDHDSSGGIDYGEWVDFQTVHSNGDLIKEVIDKQFARHDFDSNGVISEDEFLRPASEAMNSKDDL